MGKNVKRIVVTENYRSFSVSTVDGTSDSVHIDAPGFANLPNRCDYAVRVSPTRPKHFFFVELKGNDVVKAARQLVCTIENLSAMYAGYTKKEAWVISGGWRPAISTAFQVEGAKAKKYGFDLKYRTRLMQIDLV
ncbi:MAG: hypothetical protein ACI4UY_05035 [Kiritimatiellia bacterium]